MEQFGKHFYALILINFGHPDTIYSNKLCTSQIHIQKTLSQFRIHSAEKNSPTYTIFGRHLCKFPKKRA